MTSSFADELNAPYELGNDCIERFREQGFVKLTQVLSGSCLAHFRASLIDIVRAQDRNTVPLKERDTYGRAFTQIFNLWRVDPRAESLMRSRRLAQIATELLQVRGVRLYHDQALFKEPWGGHTPWHCDQFYWPLSSDRTVTAWIPLQAVPRHMGPLAFARGSHQLESGRSLAIGDRSEAELSRILESSDVLDEAFDLGEVSFHSGWTYHRARANQSDEVRAVFTIIYMDEQMCLIEPETPERQFDARSWCPGIRPGCLIDSDINPVLFRLPVR